MGQADTLMISYHIEQVNNPSEGASRSGAGGLLSFLQHPPPVPCAVLLPLGPSCWGLTSQEDED